MIKKDRGAEVPACGADVYKRQGYQSMYDNGLPIFDAAGIRTTQYIITGNTLGDTIVNPDLGPVGVGNSGYVTWDEVQTMAANGHEIGAHTRTCLLYTSRCV